MTSYTDVITVRATGRRTFFHNRGANALFGPDDVPVEKLSVKVVNLGYLLLLDGMDAPDEEMGTKAARLLSRLEKAGILTSIDVVSEDSDRFARIVTPALKHADYCIVNEIEAGRTTGREIRRGDALDLGAMETAARELLSRGVRRLVVIHTPEGCLGLPRDGEILWQPSHDLPSGFVQGTNGAGDAFLAGMLVGIHEGWALEQSLRFAVAAAATCLRHPTTTGGVGSAEDIRALARTLRYRKDFPST
jgi:sugar/nucleoside kinase (ribokinase family)